MEIRNSVRSNDFATKPLVGAGLLVALSAALTLAPTGVASAQGSCKGRPADTTVACTKTPAKAPFAPTGWKTVAVDHFEMQAADYKKEEGYYDALMNWKVRSDDGKSAALDIGDVATVVIHGGYQPPPPPPRPAGADTGGRGGRGFNRTPPNAVWDGFSLQIAPWDSKKVEAALKERGLNPVLVKEPNGCETYHVKDPDGFDVGINGGCYAKNRKANASKAGMATAKPFDNTDWKTIWLDHISFQVTNYKESVAWYQALLGWMPTGDEGSQNETWICDDCGNVIIRGGNPFDTRRPAPAMRRATIGHISFGLQGFDYVKVAEELKKRSLNAREDTGTSMKIDDPNANYKSYHTTTPGGFDLQISNGTKANRTVKS
ncbi:MAG TPA: VOC family protein [Gemmatimonadaceae bacterium]|jgi:catechol 2,3-dioxygenase-like lactoylglutathione lyase family enzyme